MALNPVSQSSRPFTVALTGGIASGKTLVSDEFAALGVPIIDTDVIAREVVEPGQPALSDIEAAFGSELIDADGALKRAKLRDIIFSDQQARKELESILHPRIRQRAHDAIARLRNAYCILVIPLLVEGGIYRNIDRVLVVDVEPETQIQRLMSRDGGNRTQAEQALSSQANREERLKFADDVLNNSGTPEQVRLKVALLNQKYLRLAEILP